MVLSILPVEKRLCHHSLTVAPAGVGFCLPTNRRNRARPERPGEVPRKRLREKLEKDFHHAAGLYEQGRLRSLETIGRYLSHWLRWPKGIGLARPNALAAIEGSLNEI